MYARNALPGYVVIALAITACQPPVQEVGRLSEEDVAAIRTVFAVHRQNALGSDWAADAALYAEDAVELPPNGAPIRGRVAIQAARAQLDRVSDFTMNIAEIDGSGDFAYAWNSYSLTTVLAGAADAITDTGKALVILRKQPDGSWLMHRVIWNADPPPPDEGGD